jgi:hypothetical protein
MLKRLRTNQNTIWLHGGYQEKNVVEAMIAQYQTNLKTCPSEAGKQLIQRAIDRLEHAIKTAQDN